MPVRSTVADVDEFFVVLMPGESRQKTIPVSKRSEPVNARRLTGYCNAVEIQYEETTPPCLVVSIRSRRFFLCVWFIGNDENQGVLGNYSVCIAKISQVKTNKNLVKR